MKKTSIGKWWAEVKSSLDGLKNTHPGFTKDSKQYQSLYKAATAGTYLDGGWAITEGPKVKKAMAELTNGLPSLEESKQSKYKEGSIALLKLFKQHLENYQHVHYDDTVKKLAKKITNDDLDATFATNAQGAITLGKVIDTVESIQSSISTSISTSIEEKTPTTTTTTTTTATLTLSSSQTVSVIQREDSKLTPIEKIKNYQKDIEMYSQYLGKLKTISREHKSELTESNNKNHIDMQVEIYTKKLDTTIGQKAEAVKEFVTSQLDIIAARVLAELEGGAYSKLDQPSQTKVRELLVTVVKDDDFNVFLTDLSNVDDFQKRLDSIVHKAKDKIIDATYNKWVKCGSTGIYLQGSGTGVATFFAADKNKILSQASLKEAILGRQQTELTHSYGL